MSTKQTALLIVGHGSRDQRANERLEGLVAALRRKYPDRLIYLGYVELAAPLVTEALAELARISSTIQILPLFLSEAGHVKRDLPRAVERVRAQFPEVTFSTLPPIGRNPRIRSRLIQRIDAVLEKRKTTVVMVARGTSDNQAIRNFFAEVREIESRLPGSFFLPSFFSVAEPRFDEILKGIGAITPVHAPRKLVVVPYFLFSGTLVSEVNQRVQLFARRYPHIQTETLLPLAEDADFLEILQEHWRREKRIFLAPKEVVARV